MSKEIPNAAGPAAIALLSGCVMMHSAVAMLGIPSDHANNRTCNGDFNAISILP
jgi:hypothetical protein